MNVPTGQYCPPSIGMVAAFKLESLAGIVGIRNFGFTLVLALLEWIDVFGFVLPRTHAKIYIFNHNL